MPFLHQVTDSRGHVHTRNSTRQYPFVAVAFFREFDCGNGKIEPPTMICSMAGSEQLARKSATRYQHVSHFDGYEIIPCTPIPTGKHA